MNREEIIQSHPIENYLYRIGANPKRAAGRIICRCPLGGHPDRHPSFTVKGDRWFCWSHPGGLATGTIIDLVMAVEGLTTGEAMRRLGWNR